MVFMSVTKGGYVDDVAIALDGAKIVPVVMLHDAAHARPLADALTAGGLPIVEVTFRTQAALEAIGLIAQHTDVLVGAGTVVEPAQVDAAVAAGARFIVSPGTSTAVIHRCAYHGVPVIPGATTATEVLAVRELGLRTVKFFPAEPAGGPAAIRALAAPFTDVQFIPTGGVNLDNLADYLRISAVLAVGGSWMVPPAAIAEGRYETIADLTAQAVALTEGELC